MPARPLSVLAASLLCLSACEGKPAEQHGAEQPAPDAAGEQPAPPAAKPTPPEIPEGPPVLTLGAASMHEKGAPDKGIVLGADGSVTVTGKVVGRIRADGKLLSADGWLILSVDAEGKIKNPEGKPMPLSLTDTGARMDGPEGQSIELSFTADGGVNMQSKDASGNEVPPAEGKAPPPEMIAEGCAGPVARTCGLAFAAYMMMVGSAVRSSAPAPAPAAPAP